MSRNGRSNAFEMKDNFDTDKWGEGEAGPSHASLFYDLDQARSDEEAEERESTWRKAETSFNPIQLDDNDQQETHILGINIIKPHRYFMGGQKNYEYACKMTAVLERYLCEISPEDRQVFFNIKRTLAVGSLSIQESRDILENLIRHRDWIDASESAMKYRKELLAMDPQQDALLGNKLRKMNGMILEESGRSGLRPDDENRMDWSKKKTMEENERTSRAQIAKQKRRMRREKAAEDFFVLWEEVKAEPEFNTLNTTDEEAEDIFLRPKDAAERDAKAEKGFKKFQEDWRRPGGRERMMKAYMEETGRFEEWKAKGCPMPQIRFSTTEIREEIERMLKSKEPTEFEEKLRRNIKRTGLFGERTKKKKNEHAVDENDPFGDRSIGGQSNIDKIDYLSIEGFVAKVPPQQNRTEMHPTTSKETPQVMKRKEVQVVIPAEDDEATVPYVDNPPIMDDGGYNDDQRMEDTAFDHDYASPIEDTTPPHVPLISTPPSAPIPPSAHLNDQNEYDNESGLIIVEGEEESQPIVPSDTMEIDVTGPIEQRIEESSGTKSIPSASDIAKNTEGPKDESLVHALALVDLSKGSTAVKDSSVMGGIDRRPSVDSSSGLTTSSDDTTNTGERKQIRRKKKKKITPPPSMPVNENDHNNAALILWELSQQSDSSTASRHESSQPIPPSKLSPIISSTPSSLPPLTTIPPPQPSPVIPSTPSSLPSAPPSKSNVPIKPSPPIKPTFSIIPPTVIVPPPRPLKSSSSTPPSFVIVPPSQTVKKTQTIRKGKNPVIPSEKQEEAQSISPPHPKDSDLGEELVRLMSYVSPPESMGGLKLAKLKEKMMKSGKEEDIKKYETEKMIQEMLHYALHKWPIDKFPIDTLPEPFHKNKRQTVMNYLGIKTAIIPQTVVYGECTFEKLKTLWNNKNAKERQLAEKSTSPTPSTSRVPSRAEKSPLEKEALLDEETVDVTGLDVPLSIDPPASTEKQPSESGDIPAEDAPISPIESPERQVLRSRGSSEESERKRKISEESSEGEPESKRTEKDSIPTGGAHLSELTEADETRNDGMEVDERMETIPPFIQTSPTKIPPMNPNIPTHLTHKSTIAILDSVEDQSQPIPAEMIIDNSIILSESVVTDPDECMIVDVLPINSTHQFSRTMDEEDQKEGVKESTGQVVGFITMGPVVLSVPSSPTGTAPTNEFEAPDLDDLNYHLPNRTASSIFNDDKEDKALVEARNEQDRQRVGISSEDGRELNYIPGVRGRICQPLAGNYQLLIYLLKSRYEDDLLPSQRHLRNFADIIQNKLVSKLREEDPYEWSHQFYKVIRSEIIKKTLFYSLTNSFEKDILLLKPSEQFDQWRNGRAFSAELLELAVKAESTPFKSLIEETLRLKDSFTIVRARTLYRKLITDLTSTFDDLKRGDEDESDDFKEIEKEATEKVKEIFIFSFYVISHSISINNRSRTALKPYELLRVMAYVLEGWTGWLERGGIFRLFVAVCDKREKEGGYIPLGRGKAIQMRNRIESRVSRICRQLRVIEDEGEERAVIYMFHQLKDKDILLASARDFKDNNKQGRHLMCEHNLGNAKTKSTCVLKFKNEEEKQAHKNVAHLWRDRDNKAATKCSKCVRYFLMESSLALHQLVAHHDYDDDEEEEEERGSDGGSSPRDQGNEGEEEEESDSKKIGRLSLKMKNEFKLGIAQWFPEEVQVKEEEESPSKNITPMEE